MGVAGGAHALHDGYTDLIYVMLPIWQAEFGLSYAAIGLLRGDVRRHHGGLPDSRRHAERAARRAAGARGRHRARRARLLPRAVRRQLSGADRDPADRGARREHAASARLRAGRARVRRARVRSARSAPTISPAISARWRCPPRPRCCWSRDAVAADARAARRDRARGGVCVILRVTPRYPAEAAQGRRREAAGRGRRGARRLSRAALDRRDRLAPRAWASSPSCRSCSPRKAPRCRPSGSR